MSLKNSLLIIDSQAETYAEELRKQQLTGLTIQPATDPGQQIECIEDVNIMLGRPDMVSALLPQAKNLTWVQSTFAGIDALCRPHLRKDYLLTGVKGIFGPLMSEYVFAYILAFERHIFEVKNNQAEKTWQEYTYRSLSDITIGIAGLGSIGSHLAKTAGHFGMTVFGLKRTSGEVEAVERMFSPDKIDCFLSGLDYLVLILPDTPESKKILNKERFKKMKPSSVVINVGRGATIDQEDLVWALQSNTIRGAVLDVFEEEPLPSCSPLWNFPNVHITPHIAATSFPCQIANIFCTNYRNFQNNQPLNHVIDFHKGY